MIEIERYEGALLGLAIGDAVGTTVEFRTPGTFQRVTEMTGGGPFHLKAGQWTDDTSMALCLAESLIERRGFDPHDQLARYLRWFREGHWSSTGECFDIGGTTRVALTRSLRHPEDPSPGPTDPQTAGNGSLMRLAPVPMFYAQNPAAAIQRAAESSRTTHGAPAAVDACRYFAGLLVGAVQGVSKDELLSERYAPPGWSWETEPLAPEIDEIARGSFRDKEPPEIQGTGYVVRSLEAALWAFDRTDSFREGCLRAVNLGEDADTTAAIYGQLAGAYYGISGIPETWRAQLAMREEITRLGHTLLELRVPGRDA
jgi:ADP-ribosyl-[dinitrogen reductase] hydrolase